MIVIILTLLYNHILIFWTDGSLADLAAADYMPSYRMRWITFGVSWAYSIVILVNQKLIMEPLSNWLVKKYPQYKWL